MERIWVITNTAAGAVSDAAQEHVLSFCGRAGRTPCGRTDFPRQPVPTPAELEGLNIDTVIIYGGDGTHAAVCGALADWSGALLLLPGGTMNLAARRVHGKAHFIDILDRIDAGQTRLQSLQHVDVGGHAAYSGVIAGPISGWVHARERIRAGRWRSLIRAVRFAWSLSFTRRVSLSLGVTPRQRARGILAHPAREPDGEMEIAAIDFHGFWGALRVGLHWLKHGWQGARGVTLTRARSARLAGPSRLRVLVDGEEHHLPTPVTLDTRVAAVRFLATYGADEASV